MIFCFEGWDTDPRETAEIPEIRAYFETLTAAWPYWWPYIEKVGDTFPHVLRRLCGGRIESIQPGLVGWRFEDLGEVSQTVMWLFTGMNRLYGDLDLPEQNNERISEEIAELLRSTLGG
ncbi:hypothetical protein [Thiocystis violacea]|uniref:hypothetical protein n=1 Tax=Thiocystis violacea TaxID=13725 RepID=UPI001F5B7C27|nr:hypothetical protein [Thiocystis violacea]